MPTIIENLKEMVSEVTEGAAEAGYNMTKQTVELVRSRPPSLRRSR